MENKKLFKKEYIPNYLTILRIIFMVIVIVFILVNIKPVVYQLPLNFKVSHFLATFSLNDIIAGIFFIIASITDFLDGFLARKYNWISDFGKLWDPLADKLLVNGALIALAYEQFIPVWIVIILVLRDFIVDAFRMDALRKNIIVPADLIGKLKTFFQMLGLIFIFFFFHLTFHEAKETNQILDWYLIQNLFILAATIFSILSMFNYILKISKLKSVKERKI